LLPARPTARPGTRLHRQIRRAFIARCRHPRPQCCTNVGKFLPGRRPETADRAPESERKISGKVGTSAADLRFRCRLGCRDRKMTALSDYQQYAHQCARRAAQANNDNERETFLEMAKAWRRIALVEQDVTRQSLLECDPVPSVSSIPKRKSRSGRCSNQAGLPPP
jgi:hypothetical protein